MPYKDKVMASLYPKSGSPFWWIEYRDMKTGVVVNRSTKLRRDDREQTRKARHLCAELTAEELEAPSRPGSENWAWAPGWLKVKYAKSHLTLIRYEAAWHALSTFFKLRKIHCPRHLTREHVFEYFTWRQNADKMRAANLRVAAHNTALLEVKALAAVMKEAVHRRLAPANPCVQLGIGRAPTKRRPEITHEEQEIIEEALKDEDEAMQIAWLIAMKHGRRITETCVLLENVDIERQTITFRNKGGEYRTKLLHPDLIPLFKRLKAEGRVWAFDMPKYFAKKWWYFFRRIGLPHLSIHSTRVTVVNRLRDAGVDIREAMDFLDHADTLIHKQYGRTKPERQRNAVKAL